MMPSVIMSWEMLALNPTKTRRKATNLVAGVGGSLGLGSARGLLRGGSHCDCVEVGVLGVS